MFGKVGKLHRVLMNVKSFYLFIYFILSKSKSLQNHWIENMSTKTIIIKYI